jgi:hypothetical protein
VKHAVYRPGPEVTCTLPEQSQLPKCLGGGSRTSKDPCGPADLSALLPNAGWLSCHVRSHPREVSPLARGVMSPPLSALLPGGFRLLPRPLPAVPSARLTAHFPLRGGYGFTTFRRRNRAGSVVPRGRWRVLCGRGPLNPGTWPLPFWFKPISSFRVRYQGTPPGLSNSTALAALHRG